MASRDSLAVEASVTLNSSASLEKEPLGRYLRSFRLHTAYRLFSEVYKARAKKDNSLVALKKILMHHEKEGVSFIHLKIRVEKLIISPPLQVSHHCDSRDQAFESSLTQEYPATQ
jgi:hypothetical protein